MKLSLWILKEELKDYHPLIHCSDPKIELEEVRLAGMNTVFKQEILYIGTSDLFFRDSCYDAVCFNNKNNYLKLETRDLFEVMNRVLSVFGHYARWENQCTRMLSQGCTLSELLTMGEYVFINPLHMVDSSQFLIANSASNDYISYPGKWADFIKKRTAPEEQLKQFNHAYPDTFSRTGVFHLPDEYFPTPSYCKNIFLNGERIATVILAERTPLPPESTCQLLDLFTPFLERWIRDNMAEDSSYNMTSHFARSLDGTPEAIPSLQRRLSLFGWERNCSKSIVAASAISGQFHFDAHLSRMLTSEPEGIYAIPYQEKLVLLCNLDMVDPFTFFTHLRSTFKTNNYYAAVSFPFTDLTAIPRAFRQALLALSDGSAEAGSIYECRSIAMKYIASIVQNTEGSNLLHPAPEQILSYDKKHHTSYYPTLFCYLKNERNHQRTSEELYIHRNTLFLRLHKIAALWDLSLDDPEERFYLLFSFYQREYTKSLVNQSTQIGDSI